MFKSLALILVLTSAALAQTTATNATSNSTANPLIPVGISSNCNAFLNSLNADSSLATCLSTLTNATSSFYPGSPTPASSDITSSLANLCTNSVDNTCSESLLSPKIASFYAACTPELTTSLNAAVLTIYDVLYAILPFLKSVCSQDNSGNYCVQGSSTPTRELNEDSDKSSIGMSDLMALLYIKTSNGALTRRDELPTLIPNLTTYIQSNIQFDFFASTFNATELCVPCARAVLTAYMTFESDVPYGPGINNSQILSNQSALYSAIQSKCPAGFLSGAVIAAGGLSGSSAIPTYGAGHQRMIALAMGVVTLIVALVL